MRVAVPTDIGGLDDFVFEHFGRAPTFTVYDMETGEVEIIQNTGEHMGGMGRPPEILANNGVDAILCTNLGPRAIMMFEQFGVKVYRYPQPVPVRVKEIIQLWKEGRLPEADESSACKEHRH